MFITCTWKKGEVTNKKIDKEQLVAAYGRYYEVPIDHYLSSMYNVTWHELTKVNLNTV